MKSLHYNHNDVPMAWVKTSNTDCVSWWLIMGMGRQSLHLMNISLPYELGAITNQCQVALDLFFVYVVFLVAHRVQKNEMQWEWHVLPFGLNMVQCALYGKFLHIYFRYLARCLACKLSRSCRENTCRHICMCIAFSSAYALYCTCLYILLP